MSNPIPPTPLDLSMLSSEDGIETHDGITWIWFQTVNVHGVRTEALGLRIMLGQAKPCAASSARKAADVPLFIQAWDRCRRFLEANPSLRLVDVYEIE